MIAIPTRRLIIRDWEERDRDLFHRINSDEEVMRFFPVRRTRAESDALLDRLQAEIEKKGFGFAALALPDGNQCIGFAGLHAGDVAPALPVGTVEIGWRLAPEFWGKGYATEAAEALLRQGFVDLDLAEIVSFAVWNNVRSTGVMRRIGMSPDPSGDFDHPHAPDTHPHLRRHVLYRLNRRDWQQRTRIRD